MAGVEELERPAQSLDLDPMDNFGTNWNSLWDSESRLRRAEVIITAEGDYTRNESYTYRCNGAVLCVRIVN